VSEEDHHQPLRTLPSSLAEKAADLPFVAIVRNREELCRWLREPLPGLEWLQVEGMSGDADAWTEVAHSDSDVPLDIVLADPAIEFSDLYRLVDASAAHDFRVTIPAGPGLLKAVKLAGALRFPVRILPGQPDATTLAELKEALSFYLYEPAVDAPVEFFHSLLAISYGSDAGSLWMILEEDPAAFLHYDIHGQARWPRPGSVKSLEVVPGKFVENHLRRLIEQGFECATCPWQQPCQGYFKWPNPAYSCDGVKKLFSTIQAAADEIGRDLSGYASTS
jgi:hypothetical protein